jgi:hypothetical protein
MLVYFALIRSIPEGLKPPPSHAPSCAKAGGRLFFVIFFFFVNYFLLGDSPDQDLPESVEFLEIGPGGGELWPEASQKIVFLVGSPVACIL